MGQNYSEIAEAIGGSWRWRDSINGFEVFDHNKVLIGTAATTLKAQELIGMHRQEISRAASCGSIKCPRRNICRLASAEPTCALPDFYMGPISSCQRFIPTDAKVEAMRVHIQNR